MRWSRGPQVVCVLLLASTLGCGTTVSTAARESAAGGGAQAESGASSLVAGRTDTGRIVPGATQGAASAGVATTSAAAVSEPGGPADIGTTVTQQGGPGTSSSYRPGVRGVSQGVTDTTVTIGVVVLKNGD